MRKLIEFENIEEMRRGAGIDDVTLRVEIRKLRVGDVVRLTLLKGSPSLVASRLVRITSIKGGAFRGKLLPRRQSAAAQSKRPAASVQFTSEHIHSIARRVSANVRAPRA